MLGSLYIWVWHIENLDDISKLEQRCIDIVKNMGLVVRKPTKA